jgi:hypothetical protein
MPSRWQNYNGFIINDLPIMSGREQRLFCDILTRKLVMMTHEAEPSR